MESTEITQASENIPTAAEAKSFEIQINTGNTESGEPVVVIQFGDTVTILQLDTAMDVGQALIKAVASSKILEEAKAGLIIPQHDIKTLN